MDMQLALILLVLLRVPAFAQETPYPFRDPRLPMEKRIDNLLSLMTIDEKVSALEREREYLDSRSELRIFGRNSRCGTARSQPDEACPYSYDAIPSPPGMGESWDPDLVRQAGAVEGYEARFITQTEKYNRQILMLWGPQSDLARDPRWGRSEEVYGEDPFFNGTMAVAFIKGLQGDHPKYWQAAALLK